MKLVLSILISINFCFAQKLIVTGAKKASYVNGSKMKIGNEVDESKHVQIKNKGELKLAGGRLSITLKPGLYDLDSTIRAARNNPAYIVDDSVYNFLRKRELHNCKPIGPHWDQYRYGSQRVEHKIIANSDTLTISWPPRNDFQGKYYVVFTNMFDEYLGLLESKSNKLKIDLAFCREKYPTYHVISEDCKEVDFRLIQISGRQLKS